MSAASPTLSVCMIVRDEEANLARALDSVEGVATETVVVDTGSVDRTLDIAREHGAVVASFAWTADFSAARNFAASRATGDWILVLDADEQATATFRERCRATLANTPAEGLAIPVLNLGDRGELQVGVSAVRLYRNRERHRFEGTIHEEVAPSIVRAGGTILRADLPLHHHGYRRSEDQRKGRRGRNLGLLERAHASDPSNPRYWHYLGLEHLSNDDLPEARRWFERVVSERPTDVLAGWSASLLCEVLVRQREPGLAWSAAAFGTRAEMGRVTSLVRLGGLSLAEGDDATADWCATELESVQAGATGDVGGRAAAVETLRAGASWERGETGEAVARLDAAVRAHPDDAGLADAFVRREEQLHGGVAGAVEAMRRVPCPHVIAASLGCLTRQERWAEAIELTLRWRVESPYAAHAMLRAGRRDDGLGILERLGGAGRAHALLWALEQRDDALVSRLLEGAPAVWGPVARSVAKGERVPARLAWVAWSWARIWLDVRGFDLTRRLVFSLPAPDADCAASLALLLYDAREPMRGLAMAVGHADRPDAQEMMGLLCHDRGDTDGAARFLRARAEAGEAPVRVYAKGAEALAERGRGADAREMIALGRRARPHSVLLAKRSTALEEER
jgi:tetratricopeptide (TPR) repeat protein